MWRQCVKATSTESPSSGVLHWGHWPHSGSWHSPKEDHEEMWTGRFSTSWTPKNPAPIPFSSTALWNQCQDVSKSTHSLKKNPISHSTSCFWVFGGFWEITFHLFLKSFQPALIILHSNIENRCINNVNVYGVLKNNQHSVWTDIFPFRNKLAPETGTKDLLQPLAGQRFMCT